MSKIERAGRWNKFLALTGMLLVSACPLALAQDAYPDRPVKLIVPSPPGSIHDNFARFVSELMRVDLKQTIVIENKPGATGMVASKFVASSPADGYTLLVTSLSNHVLAPVIQQSQKFDTQVELKPVGLAFSAVGLMLVNKSVEADSLKTFVELAKRSPGKLNYGSAGQGSTIHIQTEMLFQLSGADVTHVPYKGSIPALTALMAKEVQFLSIDLATARTAIASGHARAIAQTGPKRHSAFPQVLTLAESGYGNFAPVFWIGLAAPKGTPDAVVRRLNQALNSALSKPVFREKAEAEGWTVLGGPPEALADLVATDVKQYSEVVKRLNLVE
jgi:tripartite-type tricarboxylate transporter receptor subunit TctC